MSKKQQTWLVSAIVGLALVLDQVSKVYIKTHFQLGEAREVLSWFWIVFVENNGMAFGIEWFSKLLLTLFRIAAVGGINSHTAGRQGCSHIILRGQGIGAGGEHLSAAPHQNLCQIGRFGFQMHGNNSLHALEGLGLFKFVGNAVENSHVAAGPFDFLSALCSQRCVTDDGCHGLNLRSDGRWGSRGRESGWQAAGWLP